MNDCEKENSFNFSSLKRTWKIFRVFQQKVLPKQELSSSLENLWDEHYNETLYWIKKIAGKKVNP